MSDRRRLMVIGLDSAAPEFVFDRCLPVMPNFREILSRSSYGALRTTDPPISLPAWAVMFTGVDPGTLGMYGFRHRLNHSYTQNYGPSSERLPVPTLWQLLSRRGRRVCVIGMPPGYPPPEVNGLYISDFLTPEGAENWTFPPELASQVRARYPEYRFDVVFRASERQQLFRDIVRMTEERFALAEELYLRERWDAFAIHEVATDRLHHAYTKYFDPLSEGYVPGNPFEHVLGDYYRVLDRCLGRLLAHVDDETVVAIASDHGSMAMGGGFCINEWLVRSGYLRLQHPVPAGTPLEKAPVDWSKTRAWAAGGYYARVFFNVRGREAEGIVDPADVGALNGELRAALRTIRTPDGREMVTHILEPATMYRTVTGDPPDLMLYFDDLRWRSAGSLGYPTLYLKENDTGPDDAVHSRDGILVVRDPAHPGPQRLCPQDILDVTPTLLALLGETIPGHIQGRAMDLTPAPPRVDQSYPHERIRESPSGSRTTA